MADKKRKVIKMPAKLGRPLSNNPKAERVTVRLDKETFDLLKNYCETNRIDKAEAIRQGIKKLAANK